MAKQTPNSDMVLDNLDHFIRDIHDGSVRSFNDSLRKGLKKHYRDFDEATIDSKIKQLGKARKKDRPVTEDMQEYIEEALELPRGTLSLPRPQRFPAYIFVSCPSDTVKQLFNDMKEREHSIVDEASIISGRHALFLRVYGTMKEIQDFLTEDLHSNKDLIIHSTETHLSFHNAETSWMRYKINRHPDYKASKREWYPHSKVESQDTSKP